MKKILLTAFFTLFFTVFPKRVFAQGVAWNERCQEDGVAKIQGLECAFSNILRILVPLFGLVLFFMLINGAFKYLTSGGEPKKVQQAQETMTSAIMGIAAFFGIWFILKLIQFITGIDVMTFIIPGP